MDCLAVGWFRPGLGVVLAFGCGWRCGWFGCGLIGLLVAVCDCGLVKGCLRVGLWVSGFVRFVGFGFGGVCLWIVLISVVSVGGALRVWFEFAAGALIWCLVCLGFVVAGD